MFCDDDRRARLLLSAGGLGKYQTTNLVIFGPQSGARGSGVSATLANEVITKAVGI